MSKIDQPRFAVALAAELGQRGKPPAWLKVTRTDDALIEVNWGAQMADHDVVRVIEATLIENGGPPWVARLMMARKRERVEMLERAA